VRMLAKLSANLHNYSKCAEKQYLHTIQLQKSLQSRPYFAIRQIC